MEEFLDFSLEEEAKERFKNYAYLLLEWNKIHSLSGAKCLEEVYENIFDSIYPLHFIDDFDSCLDIGSGAGFPALPLAICKPALRFILVEPRAKRAAFLRYASLQLGLDIEIKKCLIEDLNSSDIVNVDLITSRAVMNSKDLIERGRKFLKKNGCYLFYKGSCLSKEISYQEKECIFRGNRVYFYRKDV
ncbi:16S rRNA (guanine(527)-N(7))-methyltransferase RsmG [Helicobacter sp. 12S02232-10]|uniref:16S rRNA (guanine(527)-N(7))-methyltransferase RsmG n=1 Tax=Helicobacter sp. 12S02232-10 TaxID=1476197 RepID=UPI000BD6C89F|nr:16S rRNA (guanine(527)-N(7))-methyltransferase RsmG [Helicobacter sp. 12S02232-10]PAF48776.1 16S rRNA (guanine(527)-N(7))-methyltransferase RsmG [Helicobacter sp. 12S02232-10]